MDSFGEVRFTETAKNLLNQLRGGEMTLPDFMKECAFWALRDGFDELKPWQEPSEPTTQAFREYMMLPPERKLKVEAAFFNKNPEINEYFSQVAFVRQQNKARKDWLWEIRGYFPPEDEMYLKKIDDRLLEFKALEDNEPVVYGKVAEVFGASQV